MPTRSTLLPPLHSDTDVHTHTLTQICTHPFLVQAGTSVLICIRAHTQNSTHMR